MSIPALQARVFAAEVTDVPEEMVHGRTLVYAGGDALIVAPKSGWRWLALSSEKSEMDLFACQNRMDARQTYYFGVSPLVSTAALTTKDMDKLIQELRPRLTRTAGLGFARPNYQPSDIPFPGSYRFRAEVVSAAGTVYLHGFFGMRGRAYLTMSVDLDPDDSPEFVMFTSSLLARNPVKANRMGETLGTALFIGLCIAFYLHSRKKRREEQR